MHFECEAYRPNTIIWELVKIVAKARHCVLYTPPYHCDLQPIELFWLDAKNPIGRSPATYLRNPLDTLEELGGGGLYERIRSNFNTIEDKVKMNAWWKMIAALKAYQEVMAAEQALLAQQDVDALELRDHCDQNGVDVSATPDAHVEADTLNHDNPWDTGVFDRTID